MPPLPSVPGKSVIKALERAGYSLISVNGSHHKMKSPSGSPWRA